MDSNFQVKVTADIGDLVAKIKNIETTLKKLDPEFKSAGKKIADNLDQASEAAKNADRQMNRVRLTSFALGQVIRDSGFFAQSFGLGLLAISNNIPILIDQILLLTKVSTGLGSAISLAGSLLTAGLTIWAYSSMAVDKNSEALEKNKNALDRVKLSGDQYYKTLSALDNSRLSGAVSAQDELTKLKLLYAQYQNFQLPLKKRQEAYEQMQQLYPNYFGNLAFEEKAGNAVSGAYNRLTQSIMATAQARAAADIITKNNIRKLENEQKIIDLTAEKAKKQRDAELNYQKRLSRGGDVGDIEFTNVERTRKEKKELEEIDKIQSSINNLKTDSAKLIENNLRLEVLYNQEVEKGGRLIDDENKKRDIGKSILEKLSDVYKDLATNVKNIGLDIISTDLEKANKVVDAHQKALQSLVELGLGPATKEYKALSDELFKAMRKMRDEEGKIFAANLQNTVISNKAKKTAEEQAEAKEREKKEQEELNKLMNDSAAMKTADDSTMDILKQRDKSITDLNIKINNTKDFLLGMGQIMVGPLAGAFQTMMQSGVFSFKTLINALGQVVTKLIAAIAAAAILAALISIITGGKNVEGGMSFATAFTDLIGGKGMFPGTKFAEGGIVSGPTNALIGEYPGARNNPEVVAPLDKLKSLIPSGGDMMGGGTLTAKISGNDLLILVDRARKNRNGYY